MSSYYPLETSCAIGFLVIFYVWRKALTWYLPYPPGPTRLPIIGCIHLLPQKYQEKALAEWGKKFGGIVFAKLFRTPAIVINSYEVARDLLEKRSGNYSDRPRFILFVELMGWRNALTNIPYGDKFRLHRKWMQNAFQTKESLDSYREIQRREVGRFLSNVSLTPHAWSSHFTRFSASLIMEIVYGHRVTSDDDEFVVIAERAGHETVTAGSPGSTLVDFFPILKLVPAWCPGGGFKTKAAAVDKLVRTVYDAPYNMVREKMRLGVARACFTSSLVEQLDREGQLTHEYEENIKGAAAVVYAAGMETTTTAMMTFILAMVRNPDVYSKLQEEIDRVIGRDRIPDLDDRETLPYTESVVKETYRWHTPAPLGIPHSTLKSDVYNGYYIPKNAIVIPNIWAMSQDASIYNDPQEFRPERFLRNAEMDPKNIVFGFGRRQCPGSELADRSIFLLVANIAATMTITKATDSTGMEITPPIHFKSGFVSRPEEFMCSIMPRSEGTAKLINQMNVAYEGL
ncbi:hypothetical protein QCA50_016926 [Cerrena zonata]|uniref:Cytochrome P450 n=1 Tax=Cerrena zonata TaxID=2478898 RepID=A0AAW0FEI6_9APHY